MSYVDSFNLEDYNTADELVEVITSLNEEISTLNGFKRGAQEKLSALEFGEENSDE